MRAPIWLAPVLAVAALAGCASVDYSELYSARQALRMYAAAPILINVDLADQKGLSEEQRTPLVAAKKREFEACGQDFHESFSRFINGGAQAQGLSIDDATALIEKMDEAFGRCIEPAGLVGHPEFQVGQDYLRPAAFSRSYHAAAQRLAVAERQAAQAQEANNLGLALGLSSMARALAAPPAAPCSSTCRRRACRSPAAAMRMARA